MKDWFLDSSNPLSHKTYMFPLYQVNFKVNRVGNLLNYKLQCTPRIMYFVQVSIFEFSNITFVSPEDVLEYYSAC